MIVRDRKDAAEGDEDPATGQVRPPADGRRFAFWAAIVAAVVLAIVLKLGFAPFIATFNGLQRVAADITRPTAPVETATPAGPVRPAPAAYDALATMPEPLRRALTAAEPALPQAFRFQPAMTPAEICDVADAAGLENDGWTEIAPAMWECMSDLVPLPGTRPVPPPAEPSAEDLPAEAATDEAFADEAAANEPPGAAPQPPRGSTIFFSARGPSEDAVSTIRFKLNFDDPSVDRSGRDYLIDKLDELAGSLSWSVPEMLKTAIRQHVRLVTESRGILIQVHPEDGPVRRLNVVLSLARPAQPLETESFSPP